jgi:hypothetical protein
MWPEAERAWFLADIFGEAVGKAVKGGARLAGRCRRREMQKKQKQTTNRRRQRLGRQSRLELEVGREEKSEGCKDEEESHCSVVGDQGFELEREE